MIFLGYSVTGAMMLLYERMPGDYAETIVAHEFTHHLQMEAGIWSSLPLEVLEGHAIGVQVIYGKELSDDSSNQALLTAESCEIPFYLQALLFLQKILGTSFSPDALKYVKSFQEQGIQIPETMLLHSLGAAYFRILEDRHGTDIYADYLNGRMLALSN
jgi:hypothetical protein